MTDPNPLPSSRADATATPPTLGFTGQAGVVGEVLPLPAVPGYEILSELGRGGMGVVYKALQLGLNRLVALKMILAGGHASEADLVRFRTEAEAVARLRHPGIVQVHEVGEVQGLPFFSLEFVEGGSLADRLAGTPLAPAAAARLVEQLAEAIDVAHRHSILHRDLKPANVLLAADETPKVTDFGLAKKLDDVSGQTQSGTILGTPSYMAPEQAGGKTREVGSTVDVYGLGAILYECLTGRPPFKAATPFDTMLQVVADEPVRPSLLNAAVPRDLETICLKCLRKTSTSRYQTARALADDLGNFLAGRPIAARPTGRVERAWRWCRRNRAIATAAGTALLFLVVGIVVSTTLTLWALRSADEARDNAERAERRAAEVLLEQEATQKALAAESRRRRQAREALTTLTGSAIGDLLARRKELDAEQRRFLDRIVALQQEFAADVGDDPELLRSAADGQLNIGLVQHRLGRLPEAERAYRAALKLYQQLEGANHEKARARANQATVWNNLGNLLRREERSEEAAQAMRESLRLASPEMAPDEEALLDALRTRMNQSLQSERDGKFALAIAGYREVLARLASLEARQAVSPRVLLLAGMCRTNLGSALIDSGQASEAVPELERAVAAHRQLCLLFPRSSEQANHLARALHNLGSAFAAQEKRSDAEKYLREAVAIDTKVVEEYPGVAEYQDDLANHLNRLAATLRKQEKLAEAEALWRLAVAAADRASRDRPRALDWRKKAAGVRQNLASLLSEQNRPNEAVPVAREAVAHWDTLVKDFPMNRFLPLSAIQARTYLAQMLLQAGQRAEAVVEADESIRRLDSIWPQGPSVGADKWLAEPLWVRAGAQVELRRFAAALKDCDRALALKQHSYRADMLFYRASCLARLERSAEAATILDDLLRQQPSIGDATALEASRIYALAAAATRDGAKRESRTKQALVLLQRLVQSPSYRDAARLQALLKDAELTSLHQRAEFKAWLKK